MTSLGSGPRRGRLLGVLIALSVACGCGGEKTRATQAAIEVRPNSVFFGPVALGSRVSRTLQVSSSGQAPLSVSSASLEVLGGGGASDAFAVEGLPLTLPAGSVGSVTVHFAPDATGPHEALLVLTSNDPQRPRVELPLVGSGAAPRLSVTPVCEVAAECVGEATLEPPALRFGPEPSRRAVPLASGRLPSVRLHNDGEVPVAVQGLSISGPAAPRFSIAADVLNGTGPDGTPALILAAGATEVVPLRFTPDASTPASASAVLTVRSNAVATPEVQLALEGTVIGNQPPLACLNLIRVEGRAPRDYSDPVHWEGLLAIAPGGAVSFQESRDVRPSGLDVNAQYVPTRVTFSAHAPGDGSACSTDLEDGREGLTYAWTLLHAPEDAPQTLPMAVGPLATLELGPTSGHYALELTVTDSGGLQAVMGATFTAAFKDDLVVELAWNDADDFGADVDLDLHLVRPSARPVAGGSAFDGAFDGFNPDGTGVQVSGDMNARAVLAAPAYGSTAGFHWGGVGIMDDPVFSGDDTGSGQRVEVITLNAPEQDAACANAACRYGIYVQHFEDRRVLGPLPSCTVTDLDGCVDGAPCDCPLASQRCVANVTSATGPRTGAGVCRSAPSFRVSIHSKGRPQELARVPDFHETVRAGAPCELFHVGDVVWPARGAPGDAPVTVESGKTVQGAEASLPSRFFGRRGQGGGLTCQPNAGFAPLDWYVEDP